MLTSDGEVLSEVGIKHGIFQGESLSPPLFVLTMMPLTVFLKERILGTCFGRISG